MAMEAKHIVTFSSSSSPGNCRTPVAVGIYRSSGIVAFPASCLEQVNGSNAVTLHRLFNEQPCRFLSGHNQGEVLEGLAFSPNLIEHPGRDSVPPLHLCSASSSSILLWDIEQVYQDEAYNPNELERTSDTSPVNDMEFSSDGLHLAICKGSTALIYNTESCVLDTTLVGHSGEIFRAVFSSLDPLTIITLSEDRTFKIWNLKESALIYQSHVVSASPFLCGAVDVQHQQLATGTADGMLRIFDLVVGGGFKCLLKCDVMKELDKVVTGQRKEKLPPSESSGGVIINAGVASRDGEPREEGDSNLVEMGPTIIGLFYVSSGELGSSASPSDCNFDPYISDVLHASSVLLVVMQLMILRFNRQTLELIDSVDFTESLLSLDPHLTQSRCLVPAQSSFDFVHAGDESYFISGGLFSNAVTVLCVNPNIKTDQDICASSEQESASTYALSVLSSQPLLANSPLHCDFGPKTLSTTGRPVNHAGRPAKTSRSGGRGGASQVMDHPLTFKSKVKSSGYTASPRMKMFNPKTPASSPAKSENKKKPLKSQCYPANPAPTCQLHCSMQVSDRPLPLYTLALNGSGDTVVCGSADNAVYSMKMPPSAGKTRAFIGHNGTILSTNWSHSDQWLISGSADKTARIWSAGSKDPVMVLDRTQHNFKSSDKQGTGNHLFTREISSVQFYYLDKFILLSSGNSTHLYKYHLDTLPKDDIKRYQNNFRYKLVTSLQMESSKTITALSAINNFHSYIVLAAGSNKALEIYDMNVEKCVRTVSDAQSRAIHCICQNEGSKYITHASESYDLFLTSAVMEGIKLWDLRTNRYVCRYCSHINSSQPTITAAFSPCSQYIASGSEDRSAYIYDLRHPAPLHRLSGHSETVSAVTFNPLKPMLVTSTFNGEVRFFTENKIK